MDRTLTTRRRSLVAIGSVTGTALLTTAGCGGGSGGGSVAAIQPSVASPTSPLIAISGLKDLAAAKGLLYGAATDRSILFNDSAFGAYFGQECNVITPENSLKWQQLRPTPESFAFAVPDYVVNYAQQYGMKVHGHTLVWHNSLPSWFAQMVNKNNAEAILTNHIKTVVSHYAGSIWAWDVVNEAINVSDGRADNLRKTPWLEFLGSDYLDLAYRLAAQTDPKALLTYNEYGLDVDTEAADAKRQATLSLLQGLLAKGVPVQALGIQGHLGQDPRFNAAKLKTFLGSVADLGLKILITELDARDQTPASDIATRDQIVAKAYEDYLSIVLTEPAVISIQTWGLSDRYTWLSTVAPRSDGLPVRVLPLDDQFQRKPAWNSIKRALEATFSRQP